MKGKVLRTSSALYAYQEFYSRWAPTIRQNRPHATNHELTDPVEHLFQMRESNRKANRAASRPGYIPE